MEYRMMRIAAAAGLTAGLCFGARAQSVLFDFDNAPIHTSLPVDVMAGGITAHLTATGQGMSIQWANTMGFTPAGFGGLCIYPNSINASELQIAFSQTVNGFSILYSPQELGCDDSARMRVTAYMNGVSVGTATTTAPNPGTWPTGTLSILVPAGFNSVAVRYDAAPPTCHDYGVIFLADNMTLTIGAPPPCYANCDASTTAPVLNVLDFSCFLNKFAAGDPYANCDASTVPPVLNVLDFGCFLNRFAGGCT